MDVLDAYHRIGLAYPETRKAMGKHKIKILAQALKDQSEVDAILDKLADPEKSLIAAELQQWVRF